MKRWVVEHGEEIPGQCASGAMRVVDDGMYPLRIEVHHLNGQTIIREFHTTRSTDRPLRDNEFFYITVREAKAHER